MKIINVVIINKYMIKKAELHVKSKAGKILNGRRHWGR